MSKMTLAQKIGQMLQVERATCTAEEVKKYHLGSVLSGAGSSPKNNTPSDWLEMIDSYWCASVESDDEHLSIPILYGVDAVHGNNNISGATIFPHNIGLGAARDSELIKKVSKVTTKEVMACGIDWVFAPNVALAQNYHWGRTYESFSHTPEIVNRYTTNIIEEMQFDFPHQGIIAGIKHWVGDGGTIHGIDQGDTILDWPSLESTHVAPFKQAIKSGAMTVMASFSSWNGDKCHGHKFLITDMLKTKLKFNGFVLSDMEAIDYLSNDIYQSIGISVNAGIDMFMLPNNWKEFIEHLHSHVELGTVEMDRIDDAVKRILSVKVHYGLFDKVRPTLRKMSNNQSFGSNEHREIAREAVRKSLVLLKNKDNILPLNKSSRILVTGKNADNLGHQCGGFTIDWQGVTGNELIKNGTSIWQGISKIAANAKHIKDVENENDYSMFDAAVVVIGEHSYAEGMGDIRNGNDLLIQSGSMVNGELNIIKPYGKTLTLADLHPEDYQTIKHLTDNNVPVITVLISGRPLIIESELSASAAFIAAWLPGSEGQGVSDVLFGTHDFQGKLSFPWPQRDENLPTYKSNQYSPSNKIKPLFEYGFGLQYKN
ncbi:glycoside hydrolase family 3 protein [Thalassotalea crassostreae]|nr:glycoside hydrolase family 3 protein [Thalassotalea crassostreae]